MTILEQEEYERIKDESLTGFEKVTDKGLIQGQHIHSEATAQDSIKLEMTRRLKKEIRRFNINSSKQTRWIITLTIAMLFVGIAQIGLLIYQIFTQT